MKSAKVLVAAAAILASGLASADEILEVHKDRAVGGGFGGLSGFMIGAAAGGPIGALIGGGGRLSDGAGHAAGGRAGADAVCGQARGWQHRPHPHFG